MMPRPSPRTQGITSEGETFQKYGTQQLKFIDRTQPALGVTQINTGKTFKGFTTIPVQTIKQFTGWETSTPFSQQFQAGTTGALIKSPTQPQPNGNGEKDCGWFGEKCSDEETENGCDIGCVLTGRGCDCGCNDLKPCTKCDSDVCEECDAWDIQCEDCMKKAGTCTTPPEPKTTLFWAKIIAVVIGIGVFLWLLRPLFGRGKPTGGFTITPA